MDLSCFCEWSKKSVNDARIDDVQLCWHINHSKRAKRRTLVEQKFKENVLEINLKGKN